MYNKQSSSAFHILLAFHGMDIEERFKLADEKMKKAESNGQLFGIVIQAKEREGRDQQEEDRLNSHTFYEPSDDVLIWKMPHFDLSGE